MQFTAQPLEPLVTNWQQQGMKVMEKPESYPSINAVQFQIVGLSQWRKS